MIAVVLYHAGFEWMHGGFFGVEVFFVISGFLITSLLIDERVARGTNDLSNFWLRRARRLLPALGVMLLAVCAWTLLAGSAEQASQLRNDMPWAVLLRSQLGPDRRRGALLRAGDPPLLRHLWSLAVEEQWYLVWPLVFVGLSRLGWRSRQTTIFLAAAAGAVFAAVWFVQRGGSASVSGPLWLDGADRINVMYLSTVTRSAGLLIGAGFAFGWRLWRNRETRLPPILLDTLTVGVLTVLIVCFVVGRVTSAVTYPWLMAAVSWTSALAMLAHRASQLALDAMGAGWNGDGGDRAAQLRDLPLALAGVRHRGRHGRLVVALPRRLGDRDRALGALLPVRRDPGPARCARPGLEPPSSGGGLGERHGGGVGDRGRSRPHPGEHVRRRRRWRARAVRAGRSGQGSESPTPSPSAVPTSESPSDLDRGAVDDGSDHRWRVGDDRRAGPSTSTSTTTTTTLPVLPRSVAIVGDSQAHSLFVNLPRGIDDYFTFEDGAVSGCSVHDSGEVITARPGFHNDFGICEGWARRWASAADRSDVALVVLGAWDVFDLRLRRSAWSSSPRPNTTVCSRAAPRGPRRPGVRRRPRALLEIACMRPVDARGAAVPALPERGDDGRVAHVNDAAPPGGGARSRARDVRRGPDEWCEDVPIATDPDYRWDGVHVYQRGAKLDFRDRRPCSAGNSDRSWERSYRPVDNPVTGE